MPSVNHPDCAMTAHPAKAEARSEYPAHQGGPSSIHGRSVMKSVRGHLGETIRAAFPALQARTRGDETVLTGVLADQAALYGVLAEIEELGLELIEVRRLPPGLGEERSS